MDMLERFLSGEVSVGCWDVDAVEAFRDALLFGCDSRGIVIRNWAGAEIGEEWFEKFEPGGFAKTSRMRACASR